MDSSNNNFQNSLASAVDSLKNIMCSRFNTIKDNAQRVRFAEDMSKFGDFIIDPKDYRKTKNIKAANVFRNAGNDFYKQGKFTRALENYNKSLCFGVPGSEEIGLAYANRSAVYCEMKLFNRALKNIELAMKNKYPPQKIDRLMRRKELCLSQLSFDVEEQSSKAIGDEYLKLSHEPNPNIPYIAKCLELRSDEKLGRNVITTNKDLTIGDIIIIDEPFVKSISDGFYNMYCANCLKDSFLDLVPCDGCTSIMFCSEDCRKKGVAKFHQFECNIIDALINTPVPIPTQMAKSMFFEGLSLFGGDAKKFATALNEKTSATVFDTGLNESLEIDNDKRKKIFQIMNAQKTNQESRSAEQLLRQAQHVSILTSLFLDYTNLKKVLKTNDDQDFYRQFLMKFNEIALNWSYGIKDRFVPKAVFSYNNYGYAAYLFTSHFSHSCDPNVTMFTYNCKNYIMVNKSVKSGEALTLNYTPPFQVLPRISRQKLLKEYFALNECKCNACTLNYPVADHLRTVGLMSIKYEVVAQLKSINLSYAKNNFKNFVEKFKALYAEGFYPYQETICFQKCIYYCYLVFTSTPFVQEMQKRT